MPSLLLFLACTKCSQCLWDGSRTQGVIVEPKSEVGSLDRMRISVRSRRQACEFEVHSWRRGPFCIHHMSAGEDHVASRLHYLYCYYLRTTLALLLPAAPI